MKKLRLFLISLILLLLSSCSLFNNSQTNPQEPPIVEDEKDEVIEDDFEDYGFEVIVIDLSETIITEDGLYTSKEEVGVYIYTYHKLPSNYKTKSSFKKSNYTIENKLSCGGDTFYNREGILPKASGRTYKECDIDYRGGGRNAKRIVFSSDFLIFYTDDHYASFYILRFVE